MRRVLVIHPGSDAPTAAAVEVEVTRPAPAELRLAYALTGNLGALAIPAPAVSARADGLWRRTCFEAFLAAGPGEGYFEFNFSPSTEWAAYAFVGYRGGAAPAQLRAPPRVETTVGPDRLELSATLELAGLLPPDTPWRLGLSAVIEAAGGSLSHWALAHPPGRADFHHRAGFAIDLPPTEQPCNSASTA